MAVGVYGTADDFVATPTGGSTAPKTVGLWRVDLASSSTPDAFNADDGNLTLPNTAGSVTEASEWAHTFVDTRRAEGPVAPPAVVDTFEAEIVDSLNLVGAFGAEKR